MRFIRKTLSLAVILAGMVLGLSCNPQLYPQQHETVWKVMTYNIHHANPPSSKDLIDMDSIAGVIRKQDPDLVALQEIDVHTSRSGKTVDEAALLGEKTGMHVYFAKAIDYAGGDYGIAILSRYPLSQMQTHALPTAPGTKGEPRVLATAVVNLPGYGEVLFACTHLDAQKSDTNRLLQVRAAMDILKGKKQPVMIGGDFNAVPGGAVINTLDSFFTRSCITQCGYTIPQVNPSKTIDFIAFTKGKGMRSVSHEVINEPYASDHLPVVAKIAIAYR